MKRKALALFLALALLATLVPFTALAEGEIADGWQKVGDSWYYGRDGAYLTGLQTLVGYQRGNKQGENEYLLGADGALITGFQKLDGVWYYFMAKGSKPTTSTLGQMIKNYYVDSPADGYLTDAERAQGRAYRYYFNADGALYTGWYKNDLPCDQSGKWRYFGQTGNSPISSRLGRMFRYGLATGRVYGNNPDGALVNMPTYFFSSTGGLFTGTNSLGTFVKTGSDPARDTLGALDRAVSKLTLSASSLTLNVGGSGQLTVTVAPSDVINKEVTWKSSDTKVATVDKNGLVTGVAAGSATITCTSKRSTGVSATCKLTVNKKPELKDGAELEHAMFVLARTLRPLAQYKVYGQKPSMEYNSAGGYNWTCKYAANGSLSGIETFKAYTNTGATCCTFGWPRMTSDNCGLDTAQQALTAFFAEGGYDFANDPYKVLVLWSRTGASVEEFRTLINNSAVTQAVYESVLAQDNGKTYTLPIIIYGKDASGALTGKYAGAVAIDTGLAKLVGINPANTDDYGRVFTQTATY